MATDERRRSDRRRQPRGGRRAGDRPGYTPLVLVIDGETARRDITETILARLHFAVAPVESAEKALSILQAIRPEIIVSPASLMPRIQDAHPSDRNGTPIPIVSVTDGDRNPDALVNAILAALRKPA
jgi:CheY-like chemotaxis protein